MLSSMMHRKPYMTRVIISDAQPSWPQHWLQWALSEAVAGGIETDLGDEGGPNIANLELTRFSDDNEPAPLTTEDALRVPWNARYNYRLGFGAMYTISGVVLYKDGFPETNQSYAVGQATEWHHFGFNIDPDNRNYSESGLIAPPFNYYQKKL